MYKFGRNKFDHSEKKYGLPLWLCTIENTDLITFKSKFTKSKIDWGALHWTHWGPSDSRSNFFSVYNSKISPYQIRIFLTIEQFFIRLVLVVHWEWFLKINNHQSFSFRHSAQYSWKVFSSQQSMIQSFRHC
jgi:hypothetical protein